MAENTGKLAGKTLFITGASRGIGKAIALKAAKDGANIVIAAKTAVPHPKLTGTIYTAAKEIEDAGGKCLPCVVDIRFEDQVRKAVDEAVQRFGGIDILINNASAISLTGTLELPMKKYDLMMSCNVRGTYLCSHVCLPHLLKSKNPHILTISPPLNMKPKWFQSHAAYTISKYGMSMCAMGMAEEFRSEGVAVNTLWPKTAIQSAAAEMLGGGKSISDHCRKTDIMSDAAYTILTKDSRSYTGQFTLDEDVVRAAGVTNMDQYLCVPGGKPFRDLFVDDDGSGELKDTREFPTAVPSGTIANIFHELQSKVNENLVKIVKGVIQFNLTGEEKSEWYADLRYGSGSIGPGKALSTPNCTITTHSDIVRRIFTGKFKPSQAFMGGEMKIDGNTGMAMSFFANTVKATQHKL